MNAHRPIHDWPDQERPRERLIALREATIDAYAKLFIDHARS